MTTKNVFPQVQLRPKVELHLHLEGSLSDRFWGAKDSTALNAIVSYRQQNDRSLHSFLRCITNIHHALRTPQDYGEACRDLLEHLISDNISYAEITWAPGGMWEFHGTAPRNVYTEIEAAILAYAGKIDARILIDLVRNQPLRMACDIVEWIENDRPPLVVGINVGGDEVRFPMRLLVPAIEHARRLNLGITVHAGEATDEGRMLADIAAATPDRVGHATSLKSAKARDYFIESGLHIEACPISNFVLGYLATPSEHPLLKDDSLRGSINTDDRSFFSSSLSLELSSLLERGAVSIDKVAKCQRQAVEDAFEKTNPNSLVRVMDAWQNVA